MTQQMQERACAAFLMLVGLAGVVLILVAS